MPQFRLVIDYEHPLVSASPRQLCVPTARSQMELYRTISRQWAEIAATIPSHANPNDNAVMRDRPIQSRIIRLRT